MKRLIMVSITEQSPSKKELKNKQKDSRACKMLKVKTGHIQLQELISFTQDNVCQKALQHFQKFKTAPGVF